MHSRLGAQGYEVRGPGRYHFRLAAGRALDGGRVPHRHSGAIPVGLLGALLWGLLGGGCGPCAGVLRR
jgi:hypothetical protein